MASIAFQELSELFDAADLAVQDVQELMEDGKIDWKDLTILLKLSKQLNVFNAAVQGLSNLKVSNLVDISNDEIENLTARLLKILGVVGIMASDKSS